MADRQRPKRDKDLITYEGWSGLRNAVEPYRFDLSDMAVARNVILDDTGAVSLRAGRTRKLTGSAIANWWSDEDQIGLFTDGLSLKQLHPGYSASTIATLTSTAPMAYCKVNDCVYFSNGVDKGVFQGGAVRSWGLPVPPPFPCTVTVGQMPAGEYQFTMTNVRSDGQESGAGLATRVTVPDGAGLAFPLLPVCADPGVVERRIYLTTTNGKQKYECLILDNTVTSSTYSGSTGELAADLDKQFLQGPPAGQVIGFYDGRVWIAVGDLLYYSEPNAYELFHPDCYIALDSKIALIAGYETEGLYVGTEAEHYWITQGDALTERYLVKPLAKYGAIPGAAKYVDGSLYGDHSLGARQIPMWLSREGVCAGMPGGSIANLTRAKFQFPAAGSGCALFQPEAPSFIVAATN